MMNQALGTHEIARICHVSPPAVIRWIESGKLPSFTTGGGHRRVWDKDLVVFLKEHNIPLPPEFALAVSKLKVLIVDDEAPIRKIVSRIFQKEFPEAEIHEAGDGFEAGHMLHTILPVLVVLDVQLPGLNGLKVCQMIRENEHLRGMKILAVTGQNMEETKNQALKAGADDFLSKPFDARELAGKLQKLLVGHMEKKS